MLPKKLIAEVENLIAEGKTADAVKKLKASTKIKSDEELKTYLTLLSGQWNNYKRDRLEAIKSELYLSRELNRLNKSLLSFVKGDLEKIELEEVAQSGRKSEKSSSGNTLTGILIGAFLIFGAYWFFGKTDPPAPAKEILNEYKISILDYQGYETDMFIAKIYRDFTGDIIRNGNPQPMQKVNAASIGFLEFTLNNNGTPIEYKGIKNLPPNDYYYDGIIWMNGQRVGKWSGVELKKN